MTKLIRFMKAATEVLTVAGTLLTTAIVVVETYHALRKKIDSSDTSK